jgi:hypothetical protein
MKQIVLRGKFPFTGTAKITPYSLNRSISGDMIAPTILAELRLRFCFTHGTVWFGASKAIGMILTAISIW